ncbi:hypothetical protein ACJMK2_025479 [Sinanodonta woodiana]|uniref:Chitin-binding type-4 domain-containing protein n=1 Tax=Sinanodonta woodiana TaxID=1069815 RepID=A0ABD3XIK6_SINWO
MEMVNKLLFVSLLMCLTSICLVAGTGALIDPPARSVLWKYGFEVATNYDYMRVNCGGLDKIREQNGKCGVCGDPYDGPKDNELNGKYGSGTIGRYYPAETQDIHVKVDLTGYLQGYFEFRICAANKNPVTQECLNRNLLPIKEGFTNGSPMRFYPTENGVYNLTIAIPPGFTCERCVLQWRYYTGNSWGVNPDGRQCIGCGLQEQFQNCADIRIGGSIPESMKSNKLYKEMGWLDFKQQMPSFTSDNIKIAQADDLRIKASKFGASTLNSTTINMVNNITNDVMNIDESLRVPTSQSTGMPILSGGSQRSNHPTLVSTDSETFSQLPSSNQNNLIAKNVNSVLKGKTTGKTAQPDILSPNLSPIIKFEKPVEPSQPVTEKGRLLATKNKNSHQSFNGNSLDVTVSKPVENDISPTLQGSSGDLTWPFVKEGTGRKLPEILHKNSLTRIDSDGTATSLSIEQARDSHISSSKLSTFPGAINTATISERTSAITFNSKLPRNVPGLKSESLGPTNTLKTLDLTKMSGFNTPLVRPITTSRARDTRMGLTIQAVSRPSDSSAPAVSQGFNMVGEKHVPGQGVLGLKEAPTPLIDKDIVPQSSSRRSINIGSVPSNSGSVQRGPNPVQPSLAAFEGQHSSVSQQGTHGMVSVVFSRNDSSATGVPSASVDQRTISQTFKTDDPRHNIESLHSNIPGGINPMLQNRGTRTVFQFPQNNFPSAAGQLTQHVGQGRNVMTAQSVAPGANGRSSPSRTQERIPGLIVIPQNVNQPVQVVDAPNMNPSAPSFMTFMPWSPTFSQIGATSPGGVDATFAQASSQTGTGTGMIPEIPRTSPMLAQPLFNADMGDIPAPRVPQPVPIQNGPLLQGMGPFPGNQPGPLPIMPLQTVLGGPGVDPRGLPLGPRVFAPWRPQPFGLR